MSILLANLMHLVVMIVIDERSLRVHVSVHLGVFLVYHIIFIVTTAFFDFLLSWNVEAYMMLLLDLLCDDESDVLQISKRVHSPSDIIILLVRVIEHLLNLFTEQLFMPRSLEQNDD